MILISKKYSKKKLNNKNNAIFLLKFILKSLRLSSLNDPFLVGSGLIFPILWSKKRLNYIIWKNLFKPRINIRYFKLYLIEFFSWIFVRWVPKSLSYIPSGTKYPGIIFSWLNKDSYTLLAESGIDKYYGDINLFVNSGWIAVFIIKNDLDKEQKKILLEKKYIIIELNRSFNIFYLIKVIWRFLINFKSIVKNRVNFLSFFSRDFQFSEDFSSELDICFKDKINTNSFVIQPYEAMSFQNMINYYFKLKMNARTIGFVHAGLFFFPSNIVKRIGAPNYLMISGKCSSKVLEEWCGWSKNEIISIPSIRLRKKQIENFILKIFLPYDFNDMEIILSSLKFFLDQYEWVWGIPEVRNHPLRNLPNHIKLSHEIERIFKNIIAVSNSPHKKKWSNKLPPCICVGSTAVIQEALEHDIDVIHISDLPEIQMCNAKIWPCVIVEYLTDNMAIYSLKDKNSFIVYSENENLLNYVEGIRSGL